MLIGGSSGVAGHERTMVQIALALGYRTCGRKLTMVGEVRMFLSRARQVHSGMWMRRTL